MPQAEVERVAPTPIEGVELFMDRLAKLADFDAAQSALGPYVSQYREWIERQRAAVPATPEKRHETGEELLRLCGIAAARIERGTEMLGDPQIPEAFRITNRVMSAAARQRSA